MPVAADHTNGTNGTALLQLPITWPTSLSPHPWQLKKPAGTGSTVMRYTGGAANAAVADRLTASAPISCRAAVDSLDPMAVLRVVFVGA
jgi:hypothetical protein